MRLATILPLLILLLGRHAVSAQSPQPGVEKLTFLHKSKTQRTVGRVLFITGCAAGLAAVPFLLKAGQDNSLHGLDDLVVAGGLAGGGALLALGSAPFFIAAKKNERKAATLSLQWQRLPAGELGILGKTQPAVALTIPL